MNEFDNILLLLENYNALIKYHIKAFKEGVSDERKINLNFNNLPDIERFQSEVEQVLQEHEHSADFVRLINRLYLLGQSNSDLFANYSAVEKHIYKIYPSGKDMERFSFGIYEFIRDEVFHGMLWEDDKCPLSKMAELLYKEDESILWPVYYLLRNAVNAYLVQEKYDMEHQLSFKSEPDRKRFIQQQKEDRAVEIADLSNGLCDRNFPFKYIQNGSPSQDKLFYILLSGAMDKLSSEEYASYAELNYSSCKSGNYQWDFANTSLESHALVAQLPSFGKLIRVLTNTLLIRDYTVVKPADGKEPEPHIEKKDAEPDKKVKPEYILPVPILNLVYQEFNDELWDDITLVEFLDMFTTEINKQDRFKLKPKQTTRFYYLLKKIWINSSDRTLFDTEKKWAIPFLQNYNLSYSAYTNQFVRNEGGYKHKKFANSVDKILPKDEMK